MKKKLCILHWMPVEYFPPAFNMARYFADSEHWNVSLCSNADYLGRIAFDYPGVKQVRSGSPSGKRRIGKVFAYLSFPIKTLFYLLHNKPDVILYIEPHSALPVYLYGLIYRKTRLFIHYHEYHAPNDFNNPGMRLAKLGRWLERHKLHREAVWISQTNRQRVDFFLKDNVQIDKRKMRVMPNYPPASWAKIQNLAWHQYASTNDAVRMIYVGALSRKETYIEALVDWVKAQDSDRLVLDIYSYNLHEETRDYLRVSQDKQVRLHENGVEYDALPDLLANYHVGVILYRGNTPNYRYNASNKLFEYLACGLDVIYPEQMLGVAEYKSEVVVPQVIQKNFNDLGKFKYQLQSRVGKPERKEAYFCEPEYGALEEAMFSALETTPNS